MVPVTPNSKPHSSISRKNMSVKTDLTVREFPTCLTMVMKVAISVRLIHFSWIKSVNQLIVLPMIIVLTSRSVKRMSVKRSSVRPTVIAESNKSVNKEHSNVWMSNVDLMLTVKTNQMVHTDVMAERVSTNVRKLNAVLNTTVTPIPFVRKTNVYDLNAETIRTVKTNSEALARNAKLVHANVTEKIAYAFPRSAKLIKTAKANHTTNMVLSVSTTNVLLKLMVSEHAMATSTVLPVWSVKKSDVLPSNVNTHTNATVFHNTKTKDHISVMMRKRKMKARETPVIQSTVKAMMTAVILKLVSKTHVNSSRASTILIAVIIISVKRLTRKTQERTSVKRLTVPPMSPVSSTIMKTAKPVNVSVRRTSVLQRNVSSPSTAQTNIIAMITNVLNKNVIPMTIAMVMIPPTNAFLIA
jgi:hypothetical protein